MKRVLSFPLAVLALALTVGTLSAKQLNVLFIGNSFTGRHELYNLVKALAEEGQPGLEFKVTTVIYGGRTLANHWALQTQNVVREASVTPAEVQASIALLKSELAKPPGASQDQRLQHQATGSALRNQQNFLQALPHSRQKWDLVILQSWKDDTDPQGPSSFFEYAPKFAQLAHAQGARVVLYETTPSTLNPLPLTAAPDARPIIAKARALAALGRRIDADVVPMSMVALESQTVQPRVTLRFVHDIHLNQTMAYLTACTFYGVLFHHRPEGLSLTQVTDNRFDDQQTDKDRDGHPLTRVFSPAERAELQRIAWAGLQRYRGAVSP